MSGNIIIHKIEAGDTLTSISQKTNVPLNMLYNMQGLSDVDALNIGDQIVYKNGEIVYENHLYETLSQPPAPQKIGNIPNDKNTDNIKKTQQPEYVPPVEGNNNAGCPDGKCDLFKERCLLEVTLTPTGVKNQTSTGLPIIYKYPYPNPKKQEKSIPNIMVFSKSDGAPSSIGYSVKGACQHNQEGCVDVFIEKYEILDNGFATIAVKKEGLSGEIKSLSYNSKNAMPSTINKNGITVDSKNLITPSQPANKDSPRTLAEAMPLLEKDENNQNFIDFVWDHSLRVLFKSELKDYPANLINFRVQECFEDKLGQVTSALTKKDTWTALGASEINEIPRTFNGILNNEPINRYVNNKRVFTQIAIIPNYKQTFNGKIGFNISKASASHPTAPNAGQFNLKFEGSYKVEVGNFEAELKSTKISTPPIFGGVFNFLSDFYSGTASMFSRNHLELPMAFDIFPPTVEFEGTTELQNSANGNFIHREGTVKLNPLIGFQLSFDLLHLLASALKPVAPPFGTLAGYLIDGINLFDEVRVLDSDEDRQAKLEGEPMTTGLRAAAYIYLGGRLNLGGGLTFAGTDLFDAENVLTVEEQSTPDMKVMTCGKNDGEATGESPKTGSDIFISADIVTGGYVGIWAEARIWGAGFGAGGAGSLEIKCHSKLYLNNGKFNAWFGGIIVNIRAKYSGNKRQEQLSSRSPGSISVRAKTDSSRNTIGYTRNNGDGTWTWEGQIAPPQKESEGFIQYQFGGK